MDNMIARERVSRVLLLALAMTVLTEAFYLVVWGMILFPQGPLISKAAWTATCGIAMGSVMGALTLLFVEGRYTARAALWRAAAIVAVTGSFCAFLCARIDMSFNYFGGAENWSLFVWSGILPAIFGGLLYGWLLYSHPGARLLQKAGF